MAFNALPVAILSWLTMSGPGDSAVYGGGLGPGIPGHAVRGLLATREFQGRRELPYLRSGVDASLDAGCSAGRGRGAGVRIVHHETPEIGARNIGEVALSSETEAAHACELLAATAADIPGGGPAGDVLERAHGRIDASARVEPVASGAMRRLGPTSAKHASRTRSDLLAGVCGPVLDLAFLSFLLVLALRIRSLVVSLHRTVRLQGMMAAATNLVLGSRPDRVSDYLPDVLATVGDAVGADHGYVLELGATGDAYVWSRPGLSLPSGWPEAQRAVVPEVLDSPEDLVSFDASAAGSVVEIPRSLSTRGLVSLRCLRLRREDRIVALLCFEYATRPVPPWLHEARDTLLGIGSIFAAALERRFAWERHRETEAELRQAQRLEAVGTFASGVAHNINNVLNVIVGHAEIAAEVLPPGSRATRQIELLVQAGERARQITDQILEFGRRGRWTRHPNPIDAVVAETLEQLRSSTAEPIAIRFEGSTGGALVGGEPAQLQQVIFNLIRNAAQASEPGAVVGLRVTIVGVTGARRLSHGVLRPGPYVCLTVVDAGCGMDEETHARIFEPFFTTRPAGTGLGLATAFEFVEEQGGAFDVRSAPGEGSTFEAWLPVVAPSEAVSGGPAAQGVLMLVGRNQAAVLEDEEMLAALGFEPVGFVNPQTALAALCTTPDRFDLVLVESWLTTMTGLEFARQANELANKPIILSVASHEGYETAAGSSLADVVHRPWSPRLLAAALSRHLGGAGETSLAEIGRSRKARLEHRRRLAAPR
ncbi:signal transduction histidine kinase/CheY-like chemotaxis protein [Methylobacterium sp. OAE515]|uniref:ATP-binding protein n=1 Tax=Methylobacterium sp. OAE515 TaxID=2817895 RepID=UPI00178B8B66